MDGFDWNLFAASSAGAAVVLLALVALTRRWKTRRVASGAGAAFSESKGRIDVVAIDDGAPASAAETRETVTPTTHPHGDERSFDV